MRVFYLLKLKKASLVLHIESRLAKTFSMGIIVKPVSSGHPRDPR